MAATKEVTGDTRVDSVTIHSDYATLQARDGNYLWCDGSLRKDNSYPGASADTEDIADIDASIISILEARAASGDDETIRIMIDGERIAVTTASGGSETIKFYDLDGEFQYLS